MKIDNENEYKSCHFKIEKSAHTEFRIKCFKYNVSMQDLVQEFVERFVGEDPKAISFVESFVKRRAKRAIAEMTAQIKHKTNIISEQDHETLYNLISDVENE